MSKISIVLSVILVVSGISAGNAEAQTVSPEKCKKSIEQVETYITDLFRKTPDNELVSSVQKDFQCKIEGIKEIMAEIMPEGSDKASRRIQMPSGEHIDCEYAIAQRLSSFITTTEKLSNYGRNGRYG